ncbi:alpha-glucosidase [Mycoplasmatota bacterium zrk1]
MDWYKEAIGYQIYPRSFNDSNNDGIGDLVGIIEKLDYLHNLGVTMIWLGPIYKSPMDDNGYDVSDYYNIAPEYGTMEDCKLLIDEAHKRDIKVVMDLVLNHTSDEHEWFIESRKSLSNKFRDYYIWAKGKVVNGVEQEPTNWASFFQGSAWKKDEVTKEYFMKLFSRKMPDLNWKSQSMRKDMFKIIRYWCELGIDGYRVDAVAHLDKAELVDAEPKENRCVFDWTKFSNLPRVYDYLEEINKEVLNNYNVFTVGEVGGGANLDDVLEYVSYAKNRLNMAFTFDHNWRNGGFDSLKDEFIQDVDLVGLKSDLSRFQVGLYNKSWHALYWLNHDHPRVVSQYGNIKFHKLSSKMLATVLYFMWGTAFIYNGEEIGMTNGDFQEISDFQDVATINLYNNSIKTHTVKQALTNIKTVSRDNARTPMQWDSSEYGGFSKSKPWIKVNNNHKWLNVADQVDDDDSILNHYKRVFSIRKGEYKDTILYGKYKLLDENNERVFSYLRNGERKLLIVCNFFEEETCVSFPFKFKRIVLSNYQDSSNSVQELRLRSFESIVYEVE